MADPVPAYDPIKENAEIDREIAEYQQQKAKAQASTTAGWAGHGDPWERMINAGAEMLPEQYFPKGGYARMAGRFLIPQNAVEAALMAATLPLGGVGGLAGKTLGGKVLSKIVGKGIAAGESGAPALLGRAAVSGLKGAGLGSVVAGLTGHNPIESGVLGGLGGVGGQLLGEGASAVLQSQTVKRMTNEAGEGLKDAFAKLYTRIPGAANAKEAIKRTIAGDDVADLERAIFSQGQRYTTNSPAWTQAAKAGDLELAEALPQVQALAGRKGGQVMKVVTDPVSGRQVNEPQMAAFWEFGTPEIRQWMVNKGYITPRTSVTEFNDLMRQLDRAQLVRRWMTGVEHPETLSKEALQEIRERILKPDGTLSIDGVSDLAQRFADSPDLRAGLGSAAKDVGEAVFYQPGQGFQRGVSGVPPKVSVTGRALPYPKVSLEGASARVPYLPGWGQEASTLGKAAVMAVKPEVTQLPAHYRDRPAPPPEAPLPPAPQGPADRPADRYDNPPIEPPPAQPTPPSWFQPERGPAPPPGGGAFQFQGGESAPAGPDSPEELEVNLSTSKVPGE